MDAAYYTLRGRHSQPGELALAWYSRKMTKTLIESWLAAEFAAGKNKTEATAALSKATGMHYYLSRVLDWEKGERDVPAKARQYMIRVALRHVLETGGVDVSGLSDSQIKKIADRLS